MTLSARVSANVGNDWWYTINSNGNEFAEILVHQSKGKVEVQFPQLARNEPHTVVLAASYAAVELRDPDPIATA